MSVKLLHLFYTFDSSFPKAQSSMLFSKSFSAHCIYTQLAILSIYQSLCWFLMPQNPLHCQGLFLRRVLYHLFQVSEKNIALWGLWQGKGKPVMHAFLKPLVLSLNNVSKNGTYVIHVCVML